MRIKTIHHWAGRGLFSACPLERGAGAHAQGLPAPSARPLPPTSNRFIRRLCRWALAFSAALALALLLYLRQGEDRAAAIRAGKLAYTSRAGWVNWRHAELEGVCAFLADLRERRRRAGGQPFVVSYAQTMGCRWGPLGVEAKLSRTYRLAGGLSPQDLERAAFGIFRETSEAFEEMQGSFPNSIDARSQDSSFRDGDLLGDRIAFCRALHGCSVEEVNGWLGESSVQNSLRRLALRPPAPNRFWNLPDALEQTPLNALQHDSGWFARHARLIAQNETHFRFYLAPSPSAPGAGTGANIARNARSAAGW